MKPHVVVIGTGLAGTSAILAAAALGARVTAIRGRPGATQHFAGRLDLYGTAEAPLDAPLPPSFLKAPTPDLPPLDPDPAARLAATLARRPHHPLAGRSHLQIAALLRRALDALDAEGRALHLLDAPTALPTDAGTAVLADGATVTTGPTPAEAPLAWIGFDADDAWPAESAAALFAWHTHLPDDAILPLTLPWPSTPPHPHNPALPAALLDGGPDTTHGRALLNALRRAVEPLPHDAALLLPPCLGRTFDAAARWLTTLEDATRRTVRERLAVDHPLYALRLWRLLQDAVARAAATTLDGPVLQLTPHDPALTAFTAHTAHAAHAIEDVDALILATGHFLGGGLTTAPPLREALLRLPLFLHGRLLDNPELAPQELLGALPASDHPLLALGVATDRLLRPLDHDGAPRSARLHAAGRLLGGTNALLDGTQHSVDLVTGVLAAHHALGIDPHAP